jgi:hypothetical protein
VAATNPARSVAAPPPILTIASVHRKFFTRFGVRDFDAVCVGTVVAQRLPHGFGSLGECGLMQYRHRGDAVQFGNQISQQATPDDDVIGCGRPYPHPDWFCR